LKKRTTAKKTATRKTARKPTAKTARPAAKKARRAGGKRMTADETLATIAAEVKACTKCRLHETAIQGVPGEGPASAEIMLIGEGPGFYEDKEGRPFVGASGRFLEELLGHIDLKRSDVFITNVVKHRPPENRDPLPDEVAACADYLDRQIAAINPAVIVTLGRISMARFFPGVKISAVHGQAKSVGGRLVVAMFHPAAALHQQSLRQTLIDDFMKLPGLIAKAKKQAASPVEKEEGGKGQLPLF
jgi:DNA polymerase